MKNDNTFASENSYGKGEIKNLQDYLLIADELPVLLCRFKKDGIIFFVNNAYSKFSHSTKENIYGTKFFIDPSEFEKSDSVKSSINHFKNNTRLDLKMVRFSGLNGQ